MKLIYILLFLIGLLAVYKALRLPKTYSDNEEKRRMFRKKKRQEEKDSVFKS
jgi:hypothetical protein